MRVTRVNIGKYLIILLFFTKGYSQTSVGIEDNFNSTDTIVNFMRDPGLNAWDLRCLWNQGQNCYRSNCVGAGTPDLELNSVSSHNSGCFLNGYQSCLSFNSGVTLSNIIGAKKLDSSIFIGSIDDLSPQLWGNHPNYLIQSNPVKLCPQFYDSISNDLWNVINSVPGDSIDTIVNNAYSFKFVSGGTFFNMTYLFASDQYDSQIPTIISSNPYYNPNLGWHLLNWGDRICGPNNDGAAIFLSGPGISGPYSRHAENIALLPGSAGPICVRNIHPALPVSGSCGAPVNASYYVQNSDTVFPFNGYTVPLQVKKIQINPCDTYTVNLIVGEAGTRSVNGALRADHTLGASAMIIKKHSAKTGFWQPAPLQLYDGLGQDTLVEGCPGVLMRFVRFFQLGQPDSIHLVYAGSAQHGIDYDSLPEWVYFAPGQDTVEFEISGLNDGNSEGIENLIIRLMPPGEYECPVDTTEVELWISDRPPLVASIPDTFYFNPCETSNITIGPDSISGLAPFSFQWSTGTTTWFDTVAPVNNQNYTLTIYDACQNDSLVFTMVLRTAPNPVFSLINNDSTINCADTLLPIGFEILSNYYPQFNYLWSNNATDSIIWVNPKVNGQYTYIVTIYRPCMPDSFALNLNLTVANDPIIVSLSDINSGHCPGHEFELNPTVSGGYLPYAFLWNTGENTSAISVSPMITDTFFVSITDACGIDTVTKRTIVNVPVLKPLEINGPDRIDMPCAVNFLTITEGMYLGAGGTGNGVHQEDYQFTWDNWQSTGKYLQFKVDHDTVLTLQMRDTCNNDTAVKKIPVTVFKGPFLSGALDDTLHLCLGEPALIGPEAKDGVKPYAFVWNNGSTDSALAIVPEKDARIYKVTVTDQCDYRVMDQAVVTATKPVAAYQGTNDSYDPNTVSFENLSERAITYTWVFGDGGWSNEENPQWRFATLDEASVKLVAEDRYGCRDSIENELDIPLNVFLPNSFTPNADGLNELWQPLGYGYKTLEYTVYDRWGQSVFQCALPECTGWNGSTGSQMAPHGTYSVVVIVTPINGKPKQFTGTIALVR